MNHMRRRGLSQTGEGSIVGYGLGTRRGGTDPMEMHQVRYFLAAARLLNFTRAAIECNVSQPSLTKAILKLEEEFGAPLFRRERARTHLTELGKATLPHLQQTYDAAQAARQLARNMHRAEVAPLAVGLSRLVAAEGLLGVLADLREGLGGMELELIGGSDGELLEAALAGRIDLAVLVLPDERPDRLDTWPLFEDEYGIVVPDGHALATATEPDAHALEAEHWIDLAGDGCAALARHAGALGGMIAVRHQAQSVDMVRQMVRAGLGCAWLPRGAVPDGLAVAPARLPGSTLTVELAAVAGRRRSVGAEAFVRACRARGWAPGAAAAGPAL